MTRGARNINVPTPKQWNSVMLRGKRLLVVEEEFLVAIDIQHVLEAANVEETRVARSLAEAAGLREQFSDYDIAVVQIPDHDSEPIPVVSDMEAAGIAVVLTSFDAGFGAGYPGHPGIPVVVKPFVNNELVLACHDARTRRVTDYES